MDEEGKERLSVLDERIRRPVKMKEMRLKEYKADENAMKNAVSGFAPSNVVSVALNRLFYEPSAFNAEDPKEERRSEGK